jgi:sporulation protein YlmC with PRC-barrel domain
MSQKANLKNARHLLQQEIVLIEDEAHTIGTVTDIFLHPARGTLGGVTLRLADSTTPVQVAVQYLLFMEMPFANERAAALTNAFTRVADFGAEAIPMQDFLGAEIVTDEGQFGGQVQEVYFDEESLQTIYHIKRPGWRGFLGGKYFIAGSDGDFYSKRYQRLILPSATPHFKSLSAAADRLLSASNVSARTGSAAVRSLPTVR